MSRSAFFPALAASLVCAVALSGCLTPRAKPAPSVAVQEARARVGAKVDACAVGDLASVSPVTVGFGFGETTLDETAQRHLAKAAAWLKCNTGVEVTILPSADAHGTPAKQRDLAAGRAKAVLDQLRTLGAQSVVHTLAADAPDPVTAPHLVIRAEGRGW
jgi:outer membrane protein OmpA-like peptidoglycan-associated protein